MRRRQLGATTGLTVPTASRQASGQHSYDLDMGGPIDRDENPSAVGGELKFPADRVSRDVRTLRGGRFLFSRSSNGCGRRRF
jgi:hypothetical protein